MEIKLKLKKKIGLYKICYYIGAKTLILLNRAKRKLIKISQYALRYMYKTFNRKKLDINRRSKPFIYNTKLCITLAKRDWNTYKTLPFGEKIFSTINYIVRNRMFILNYFSPILAAVVLVVCVGYFNNRTWALSVEYGGSVIGYVHTESDFYSAKKLVTDRIVNETYVEPESTNASFSLIAVEPEMISNSFELSDQIIRASGNEIALASGLYVDDKFLGAVTDNESLLNEMVKILEPYKEDNKNAKITFLNKIQLKDGLFPVSSIVDYTEIAETITSQAVGETIYTVVAGDSPWVIASKNNVPYSQLLRLNPTIETRLMPGQELTVQAPKPFLDVKIIKTQTYIEETPFEITRVNDAQILKGQTAIGTNGVNGKIEVTAEVTYVNGIAIDTNVLDTKTIKEPVTQVVKVGTNTLNSGSSTAFQWPVRGKISAGWYGYAGHTAIDITGAYGTPIKAAASGTVTLVKNSYTGYGRHIMISHGNGIETLYAHNSKLIVSPGQKVSQGEVIAYMGSTGNSSGNHCHFEVRINGRYVNPMAYLPK